MSRKNTLKKLLGYLGKNKYILIAAALLAVPAVICALYIPYQTGKIIDIFSGDFTKEELLSKAAPIPLLALVYALIMWLIGFLSGRISANTVGLIRQDAISKLKNLPLSYIDTHGHGTMVNTITSDADKITEGLNMFFKEFFTGVLTIIGTLVFMFSLSPLVAVAVVLLTPLSLFTANFISKKTYSLFKKDAEQRAVHAAYAEEMISGIKYVKIHSQEEKVSKKYGEINEEFHKTSQKAVFFSSLVNPTTRFTNNVIYAAVAFFGAMLAMGLFGKPAGFTVGILTTFLSYAGQYAKPFNEISGVISELQDSLACASEIFSLIDEQPEDDSGTGNFTDASSWGHVIFDNVSFSYNPDHPLINNFSLDVPEGTNVAIVGKTGAGKTTLINLLMRFYECDSGRIIVDGKNITDLPRRALRSRFGMVLQDTWLTSGTVFENLSFGRTEATREDVTAAAKITGAHNFIKKLPHGYDTPIYEGGALLSEGQRQLLCITRVFVANPPILILDEATSSVDPLTEINIKKATEKLSEGRTTFTVAHRLSTIKNADVILLMDKGSVAEIGSHRELLAKGGLYASLYGSQFEGRTDE